MSFTIDEYVKFGENDSSQYVEEKLPIITNKNETKTNVAGRWFPITQL
jgi:hypothetical protein